MAALARSLAACCDACARVSVLADFPRFTVHRIDNFGTALGQTALVDIDRDGDLD